MMKLQLNKIINKGKSNKMNDKNNIHLALCPLAALFIARTNRMRSS